MNSEILKELIPLLKNRNIIVEEKISYLILKKQYETFYITELEETDEKDKYYIEVYHKDTHRKINKQHGLIPDSHLQFRGIYTLKTAINKLWYHKRPLEIK